MAWKPRHEQTRYLQNLRASVMDVVDVVDSQAQDGQIYCVPDCANEANPRPSLRMRRVSCNYERNDHCFTYVLRMFFADLKQDMQESIITVCISMHVFILYMRIYV